jgi:hypothetical protein
MYRYSKNKFLFLRTDLIPDSSLGNWMHSNKLDVERPDPDRKTN